MIRSVRLTLLDLQVVYAGPVVSWPREMLQRTTSALEPLANASEARAMKAYMKDIAPFLGIRSNERRRALHAAWRGVRAPTSDELGETGLMLAGKLEREFSYAAYDLIARYVEVADETFLIEYMQDLLVTKPWWDTVDGLGTAGVSPLCRRFDAFDIVWQWSRSQNLWLNRAAIQHQRAGSATPTSSSSWNRATPLDVARVLRRQGHWMGASRPRPIGCALGATLLARTPRAWPRRGSRSQRGLGTS